MAHSVHELGAATATRSRRSVRPSRAGLGPTSNESSLFRHRQRAADGHRRPHIDRRQLLQVGRPAHRLQRHGLRHRCADVVLAVRARQHVAATRRLEPLPARLTRLQLPLLKEELGAVPGGNSLVHMPPVSDNPCRKNTESRGAGDAAPVPPRILLTPLNSPLPGEWIGPGCDALPLTVDIYRQGCRIAVEQQALCTRRVSRAERGDEGGSRTTTSPCFQLSRAMAPPSHSHVVPS